MLRVFRLNDTAERINVLPLFFGTPVGAVG